MNTLKTEPKGAETGTLSPVLILAIRNLITIRVCIILNFRVLAFEPGETIIFGLHQRCKIMELKTADKRVVRKQNMGRVK